MGEARLRRFRRGRAQKVAGQLHGKSVRVRRCGYLEQILAAIGPPKKAPAISFASGQRPIFA